MGCRLPLIRRVHTLKRRAADWRNISISLPRVVRNSYYDEEGFRLTILILLLPPGRFPFSEWNRKILLLPIYCACSPFSILNLFLRNSSLLVQQNLVQRLKRLQVILYRLITSLSYCC